MNDVNKCYRLKLFLQQFFINSAVLNSQVPINSRIHIIEVLSTLNIFGIILFLSVVIGI